MWTCPNCKREFKLMDQWHSCYVTSLDHHFINKLPVVRLMFDQIVQALEDHGAFTIIPVKSSIEFKNKANFASIKVKKDHLDLEFQLGRELDVYPISLIMRVSRNRVIHGTTIDDLTQIDSTLIALLKESYDLINN